MKQILLVYASQTGFTQRYAQWIGRELDALAIPQRDCTQEMVEGADLVIFGGSVRGSIITGQTKLERMLRRAGGRQVIWFAVGIRPDTPRTLELVRKNNFSKEETPELFYFRGGMDPEQLKPGDKTLITCYRAMMKRRRDLDPEDREIITLLRTPCDYTDPERIAPLVRRARELTASE